MQEERGVVLHKFHTSSHVFTAFGTLHSSRHLHLCQVSIAQRENWVF
ncbi:hypothetical protein AAZX31_11G247600 [Glycine max]